MKTRAVGIQEPWRLPLLPPPRTASCITEYYKLREKNGVFLLSDPRCSRWTARHCAVAAMFWPNWRRQPNPTWWRYLGRTHWSQLTSITTLQPRNLRACRVGHSWCTSNCLKQSNFSVNNFKIKSPRSFTLNTGVCIGIARQVQYRFNLYNIMFGDVFECDLSLYK